MLNIKFILVDVISVDLIMIVVHLLLNGQCIWKGHTRYTTWRRNWRRHIRNSFIFLLATKYSLWNIGWCGHIQEKWQGKSWFITILIQGREEKLKMSLEYWEGSVAHFQSRKNTKLSFSNRKFYIRSKTGYVEIETANGEIKPGEWGSYNAEGGGYLKNMKISKGGRRKAVAKEIREALKTFLNSDVRSVQWQSICEKENINMFLFDCINFFKDTWNLHYIKFSKIKIFIYLDRFFLVEYLFEERNIKFWK